MIGRLRQIHGVSAVGATSRLPLRGEDWASDLSEGGTQHGAIVIFRFVTPDYWKAMGIPLAMSIAIRAAGYPTAEIGAEGTALSSIDSEMALPPARTTDQILDASVAARRFEMRLIVAFAIVALLPAALGIYGVISCTAARRTPKIGIASRWGPVPGK